jgi:CBS domain-containing protein
MLVRYVMQAHPHAIDVGATSAEAAASMRDGGVGALLVMDGDRMAGLVTDRDLAVRGLAEGHGPGWPVNSLMTKHLVCVRPDSPVERAQELMAEFHVKRLPVRDERGLHGLITQTDIACACEPAEVGAMVEARVRRDGGSTRWRARSHR